MGTEKSGGQVSDPAELNRTLADIAEQSQRLVSDFLHHQVAVGNLGILDLNHIGQSFMGMTGGLANHSTQLAETQLSLWQDYLDLWQRSASGWLGRPVEPTSRPDRDDRCSWHDDGAQNVLFDFIKQSYLLTARWLQTTVGDLEGLDGKNRRKLDFYTRQFIDALSPGNFVLTNPKVLRVTLDAKGRNLLLGLENLLSDLEHGKSRLGIRRTDLETFEPGRNVAVTPGQVIYQNALMQLIQYQPSTDTVHRRPLLIIPPWINKFYILDLRPHNSFIRWAIDRGFTVFVISWVNPDAQRTDKNFEDYLREGPLAALEAIEQAIGERRVDTIGYCLGGTLLACAASYLAACGDARITSCSFFATLLDFERPGELEVFIDEEELTALERRKRSRSCPDGAEMATTFNMLRANDLIWSFFVNNYLLGKEPFPFDLLYWNSDSTRLPAAMHSFYLRNLYQNNLLREPGGITLLGKPIDLGRIHMPVYSVATSDDHIAPWTSVYSGARQFGGPVRFVLGGSGHIAGIVNPPGSGKYGYRASEVLSESAQEWSRVSTYHDDSWWSDWLDWQCSRAEPRVAARQPGAGRLAPIEPAPGRYVRQHPGR